MTGETVNPESTTDSFHQYETVVLQDEFGNIINCENDEQIVILQPDENGMVQGENGTIGYFDGEQIIYMADPNQENQQTEQQVESTEGNDSSASESHATASTSESSQAGHSVVPVFDVYMKNGNVTGFVVNDNAEKGETSWKNTRREIKELQLPK